MAQKMRLFVMNSVRNNGLTFTTMRRSYYSCVNEPTHPIPNKEPKWMSAEEVVSQLQSGAAATPPILVRTLAEHRKKTNLKNVGVHHIQTSGANQLKSRFELNCLLTGADCLEAMNSGRAHFPPVFWAQIPKLLTEVLQCYQSYETSNQINSILVPNPSRFQIQNNNINNNNINNNNINNEIDLEKEKPLKNNRKEMPPFLRKSKMFCNYRIIRDPRQYTHLTVIRRRKMKKHQRIKWRKKMLSFIKKKFLKRNIKTEKLFRAELLGQIKEAEEFDPELYVKNILQTIDNMPEPETPSQKIERIKDLIRKNRKETNLIKPKFDD